ncbi:hypothetical protein [Halobacillus seohaensis]|uniref:Uncharacterized protein n=1 Tax=Halobacillus seohaensis TaxID=447421 RepID=A0ABW2EMM5_9BACI
MKWKEQQHLKRAVKELNVPVGYGIAEQSSIDIKNKQLTTIEGYVQLENYTTS